MIKYFHLFYALLLSAFCLACCAMAGCGKKSAGERAYRDFQLKSGRLLRGEFVSGTDNGIILFMPWGKNIEISLSELVFEEADGFMDGLAPVKMNGRWGYIDKKGEILIGIY